MMRRLFLTMVICTACLAVIAQSRDSGLLFQKDSTLRALIHQDSVKIEKQFKEKARWANLAKSEKYPVINAGKYSGVFPVLEVTEAPDPNLQYKLLFVTDQMNPDSLLDEPDQNLTEIARIINLHVASGIPLKNISVVVVAHGRALNAISTDASYQKRFKMNNPNIMLIKELEKIGARFIACGQAMDFIDLKKADLLPVVKIAFTAQTMLTSYQLRGYVLKSLQVDDK